MTNLDHHSVNRVRFHPYVHAVHVLSLDDYTPREIEASWYSAEEMGKIIERCWKVISRMDSGRGEKYCIRGLEGHSKLGSISKMRTRSTAIGAVLMEQSQQWIENRFDEHAIADVCRRTTSSCQMWAQVMGKKDRQAADEFLLCQDESEKECLNLIGTAIVVVSTTTTTLNEESKEERTLKGSKEYSFPTTTLKSSCPTSPTSIISATIQPVVVENAPPHLVMVVPPRRTSRTARSA